MRKYVSILLLFVVITLSSCGSKENYSLTVENFESFYDVNTSFHIDDVSYRYKVTFDSKEAFIVKDLLLDFELHFEIHKKDGSITYQEIVVNDLNKLFYEEIEIEEGIEKVELYYFYLNSSSGKISSKKNIVIEEKKYVHLEKNPKGISLVKEDEIEDNKKHLNELNEKINSYNIENENQLIINVWESMTLKIDGKLIDKTNDRRSYQLQASPFYLHSDINMETVILQEKNGGFLIAPYSYENMQDGKYVATPLYLDQAIDQEDLVEEYEVDATKMKIEIKNNVYKITSFIKDLISDEIYTSLVELYTALELDISILETATISLSYTFENESIKTETNMSMKVENVEVEMKTITTIKIEGFELKDIYDENIFIVSPPTNMSVAIPLSELDHLYKTTFNTNTGPHYYKFNLEKGQYDLSMYVGGDYPVYKIYDENYREVNVNIFKDSNSNNHNITTTFIIPSDGTYYLSYEKTNTSNGYSFMLSKLDYKTIFNKNEMTILESKTYELDLEGNKDIIGYYVSAPKNSVLKLKKVTGDENSKLNVLFYSDEIGFLDSAQIFDKNLYIPIDKGYYFYFYDDNYEVGNKYQIEVEIITSNIYFNYNYNNMKVLTNEYTKVPIIMGRSMSKSYLKFSVAETSEYKFLFEYFYGFGASLELYTKEGIKISSIGEYTEILLEAGDYYIECGYEYLIFIFNLAVVII